MINFNNKSTHLELFYAKWFIVDYIYIFLRRYFLTKFFCTWSYQMQMIFKQTYLIYKWDLNRYFCFE